MAAFLVNFPIRPYSQILDQHCLIKDRGKPRGFKKRRVMHKLNRSQRFIKVHIAGWHWVNMRKSSGRFAGGDGADVVSFLQFFGDKSATRWLLSSATSCIVKQNPQVFLHKPCFVATIVVDGRTGPGWNGEAWNKEEGHLGRLQKICESKAGWGAAEASSTRHTQRIISTEYLYAAHIACLASVCAIVCMDVLHVGNVCM